MPTAVNRILGRGRRGDFLAAVSRSASPDRQLVDVFRRNYPTRNSFRVEDFRLERLRGTRRPSDEVLSEHSYFWLTDHSRFWFYAEEEKEYSFPAILLTDTGALALFYIHRMRLLLKAISVCFLH